MAGLTRGETEPETQDSLIVAKVPISPGSSGLGTRAVRWALSGSALGSGIFLLLSLPSSQSAVAISVCALLTVAMFALTTPGEGRLPPARALLAAGGALGCIILTLAITEHTGSGLWTVDLGSYVFALLVVRGHTRVGGGAGALAVAIILGWSWLQGIGPSETLLIVGRPLTSLVVGFVWLHVLQRIAERSRILDDDSARAKFEAQVIEQATAQSQREIAEIERRTAPLFERIAGLPTLSQADRDEARVLEAELRDWLRSPDLAAPAVSLAAALARGRGVEVVLLGAPESSERAVNSPVFHRIAELINTVESGRVTVRRAADDRKRITLLIDTGELATTRRWELSE